MSRAVLVLEDDPLVRRAVVRQVEASAGFHVVAEAADLVDAGRAIEARTASVGLFDLELRDGSALSLLPRAVELGMDVLVLTIWDDDDRVYRALAAGAGGYVLKGDASAARLAEALGVLVDGGAPISPTIARRLLDDLRGQPPRAAPAVDRAAAGSAPPPNLSSLTERERDIIELFAKGATYDEVAALLAISVNTVRHHVRRMYRKLHVSTKTEAVTLAFPRA